MLCKHCRRSFEYHGANEVITRKLGFPLIPRHHVCMPTEISEASRLTDPDRLKQDMGDPARGTTSPPTLQLGSRSSEDPNPFQVLPERPDSRTGIHKNGRRVPRQLSAISPIAGPSAPDRHAVEVPFQ